MSLSTMAPPVLSKVSTVTSIRINDTQHATDVICQVKSFSPPHANYKFLNCQVADEQFDDIRHLFSFKVKSQFFAQVQNIVVGDVICIKRSLRVTKERRSSNNYVLRPTDLNIQLEAWRKSTVNVLFTMQNVEISNFGAFNGPAEGMVIRGKVDVLPHKDGKELLLMLADAEENLLEIKLRELYDVKKGDSCVFRGNLVSKDNVFFLDEYELMKIEVRDENELDDAAEEQEDA